MPYIKLKDRLECNNMGPKTSGELSYMFTDLIRYYLNKKGLSYNTINDIIGALEGSKLEFYRRIAGPYEAKKAEINGDVYE